MIFNNKEYIPYGKQTITRADIREVIKALKSNNITQGPRVEEFEKDICRSVGSKYSISLNSATSALHLSCLALNLKAGDSVWTTPISFVASANCALYCRAKIDFVDINQDTGLLDEDFLEEKLKIAARTNSLPKIIIPVHLGGTSCNMQKIFDLSKEYGFSIIEDASHALGGSYKNAKVGECKYSDVTIFSFHPVKIITTGEGGVVTTNKREVAKKIKQLRSHGITKNKEEFIFKNQGDWYYEQNSLGYNYRLNDMQAALGISQLKRLDLIVKERNKLLNFYKLISKDLPFSFLDIPENVYSAVHLGIIRFNEFNPDRHKSIFSKLRKKGVGVQLHYSPIHLQPYFRQFGFSKGDFPNSEKYSRNSFSIPLFPGLKKRIQIKIINYLSEFLK
tara:strand:+ start:200 stop:1375 length:1176 start_codon:yes stop_codon:yes gene_type:complete